MLSGSLMRSSFNSLVKHANYNILPVFPVTPHKSTTPGLLQKDDRCLHLGEEPAERGPEEDTLWPEVGKKTWSSLVKKRQGMSHRDAVPPLCRPDGTAAISSGFPIK